MIGLIRIKIKVAYGENKRIDGLDELTALADDDLFLAGDATDSYRAKKITKANLATDLSAVDASETVKGVAEEATDAQVLAGTATGETGAKLFVTPAKLVTNLPSMTGGNLTFSAIADENLTIGQPVGVSNNKAGYIAQANRSVATDTIDFTCANTLDNAPNTICSIATDKFVFLDVKTATDELFATVGIVDPNTKTVSLGTSLAITADIQGSIYAIAKLDTDKFIVFYQEDASNTIIKYRIGTVSTSTITFGAATTFVTTSLAYTTICVDYLSTDKGIMVYTTAGTTSRAIAFTVSETVASPGTPIALGTAIDDSTTKFVVKISTDKFAIIGFSTNDGECQIGTCIGGTTITLGSEVQFSTVTDNSVAWLGAVSPTTDTIILRYKVTSGSTDISAIAATISGTIPTFGTALGSVLGNLTGGIYADSTSSAIISGGTSSQIVRITLSGTTLSNQGNIINCVGQSIEKIIGLGTYWIGALVASTTLSLFIEGMSNGFIGIAQSTVSKGDTVNILYRGKDVNQNNLIPGGYYLASNGAFSLVASSATVNTVDDMNIVKALSTNEILI